MLPTADIQIVINFLRGQDGSWRAFITALANLIRFGAGFLPDQPVPAAAMLGDDSESVAIGTLEKILKSTEETRFQAAFDPSIWVSLLPVLLELFSRFLNRGR